MKYGRLLAIEPVSPDFCFVTKRPVGMPPAHRSGPAKGVQVGADYPTEPGAVTITIDESRGGLELPSCIGNSLGLMIVSAVSAALISESFDPGQHEVLPLTIMNEKGRVHGENYVLFNPIGTINCVDGDRSDIVRTPSGSVVLVNEYVIDSDKVPEGRDLFRVPEFPRDYFFSERLMQALVASQFTNFSFAPVAAS